jgi:hypothetical protein
MHEKRNGLITNNCNDIGDYGAKLNMMIMIMISNSEEGRGEVHKLWGTPPVGRCWFSAGGGVVSMRNIFIGAR